MTLYIYRVGKTYPARNPVYRSKSIKNSNCTRTPRPVRPPGHTGQTGLFRLLPILVVNICPLFFGKACVPKNTLLDQN